TDDGCFSFSPSRLLALDHAELPSAAQPFEGWRVHRGWIAARYRESRLPDTPLLSAGEIADVLERDDAVYREMGRTTLLGDTAESERPAGGLDLPAVGANFNAGLCRKVAKMIHVDQRLRSVREKLHAP